MTIELPRRSFLLGLGSLMVAPAIVRASSLMPVKAIKQFTLVDYEELILKPMMNNLQQQIQIAVLYGSSYATVNSFTGFTSIPPEDVYLNDLHSRH